MEFADAAIIAAFEFFLHEIEMTGSPNQLWMSARTRYGRMNGTTTAFRLRIHQCMRAGIGTAGRKDAGDAFAS